MTVTVLTLVVLAVLTGVWVIVTKNRFTRLELRTGESLANIEVALNKRHEMLTKLMDSSKGYMGHEKEVLTQLVSLPKGMDIRAANRAQAQMNEFSSRLFAVVENYPELRSSDVFMHLQQGMASAEGELQEARERYNADVMAYNTAIALFPASLLAGRLSAKEYFQTEDSRKADVKISF